MGEVQRVETIIIPYSLSSTMIHGVGRDGEYVARAIAERTA